MPAGKMAGEYCVQLDEDLKCKIFGSELRPEVCAAFKAGKDVCGESREQAMLILTQLEKLTSL